MTDTYDIDYDTYEITLEELDLLAYSETIAPGVTQNNVLSSAAAYDIINEAANNGERVEIHGHDSASNLMVPFFSNEGHGRGISATYLLDEIWTDRNTSLSDVLREYSPIGELGEIDFYMIIVYEK